MEKFRAYAAMPMSTVVFSEYKGVREGRAYITVHKISVPPSNWTETVYWVKANKLSPQEIRTLDAARAK